MEPSLTDSCDVRCSFLWDLFPYFLLWHYNWWWDLLLCMRTCIQYDNIIWIISFPNISPFPPLLRLRFYLSHSLIEKWNVPVLLSQPLSVLRCLLHIAEITSSCLFLPMGFGLPRGQGQDFLVWGFSRGLTCKWLIRSTNQNDGCSVQLKNVRHL